MDFFDMIISLWCELGSQSCFWAKSCFCSQRTATLAQVTFDHRFGKFRLRSTYPKLESGFFYPMCATPFGKFQALLPEKSLELCSKIGMRQQNALTNGYIFERLRYGQQRKVIASAEGASEEKLQNSSLCSRKILHIFAKLCNVIFIIIVCSNQAKVK